MNRTLWQKIYSFFGFWKYNLITEKGTYKVIYWCCFPFKFYRKFDLFKYKVN